ncbi:hypothetical protein GCM10020000_02600 [Streptomyces olivoverticillatus]
MGKVLRLASVTIQFRGSPVSKVAPMPRFLRIITGDAKAFTSGPGNANASWSCVGFEDRQLKDKYPICPGGSDVVRTLAFQSCWDGRSIDSANHRTHVAFAGRDGSCPRGFKAVPQLVQRITYHVLGRYPVRRGQLPRATAQAGHGPRRLHQRHAGRADDEGGVLRQRRTALLSARTPPRRRVLPNRTLPPGAGNEAAPDLSRSGAAAACGRIHRPLTRACRARPNGWTAAARARPRPGRSRSRRDWASSRRLRSASSSSKRMRGSRSTGPKSFSIWRSR